MEKTIDNLQNVDYYLTSPHFGDFVGGDKLDRVNIEAERGRLQMTKSDMCKELGITLKTYNGYIRGSVIPSDILEHLRIITGQPVDYLLGFGSENNGA